MFNEIRKEIEWNGEKLALSTGKIARQADGAVLVSMGDTRILCTAVVSKEKKEDINFLPLTVNYQEKTYAEGKIPGGFIKREGKSTDHETLISRFIDRALRPMFPDHFFNEVHIICTVHSYDARYSTDILALIGASAALAISGAPYTNIVAAAKIGLINGDLILNPTGEKLDASDLDLIVAGTKSSLIMVESESNFVTTESMLDAMKFAHESLNPIIALIEDLQKTVNKDMLEVEPLFPESLKDMVEKHATKDIVSAFALKSKQDRYGRIDELKKSLCEKFDEYTQLQIETALREVESKILRNQLLETSKRIDGRGSKDIRNISTEVSLLPSAHGSALFTRGETQSLVTSTLGTAEDEQIIDNLGYNYKDSFILHYIFPPYSTGDISSIRAPSRREIGHGRLARRAINPALPSKEDFPYTIRVVSEITESNGSSSMATVCGSSMAMMDAGVPIKQPVAGIAMGLVQEKDNYVILSDIIADEDHLGDMDFKVTGNGGKLTALQMDIKNIGISMDVMKSAILQACEGIDHILGKMQEAINVHGKISENAPVIQKITVPQDKIKDLIGPGGKVIKNICEVTSAKINIDDSGTVFVSAVGNSNMSSALEMIENIIKEPEIGTIYEGTVVKILPSGAFVNYLGNNDGFVHISEIADEFISDINTILQEGQKVRVKLVAFERGKGKLTIKNVDNDVDYSKPPKNKNNKPVTRVLYDEDNKKTDITKQKDGDGANGSKRKYFK